MKSDKNQKDDRAHKGPDRLLFSIQMPLYPMTDLIFLIGPVQHRPPAAKVGLSVDMPIEQLFRDAVDVFQGFDIEVSLAEKLVKAFEGRVPVHEGLMK